VQTAIWAACVGGGTVIATPITLFGTGIDDLGTPLAAGATDPHYTLVASDDPAFPGPEAFAVGTALPAGWIATAGGAQWITPQTDPLDNGSPLGSYLYRTTFDLSEADPTTASIAGLWAVDNIGLIPLVCRFSFIAFSNRRVPWLFEDNDPHAVTKRATGLLADPFPGRSAWSRWKRAHC